MNMRWVEGEYRCRIVSRADLPERMRGLFSFSDAYKLCCEWNRTHEAAEMAWPEAESL